MSISTTATKDSYAGNNSIVTQYPITFKYFEESHISVYFDGVLQTKGAGADYVMGGDGTTSTGYITTNVAQAGTVTVSIVLDVPLDQPVVLQETGSLPAKTIEVEGFDRLNMQVRRVWRKLQDVLTFNTDEAGASTGTADNLIGFDGSGDIAEIPNSTFLQQDNNLSELANAPDQAAAQTNLNVDPAGTDNSTDVTKTGAGTYISLAGQVLTVDAITESDISDLGAYIENVTGSPLSELQDATITTPSSGQVLSWNGSAWVNSSTDAVGGMLSAVYDPNTVGSDAFDMDNMVEGGNTKILTSAERTNIGSAMQPTTYDPNTVAGDAFDSVNHTYTPAGTGAVDTTVEAKLRESVSVKDFGAVGDGVTDDTAKIQAAIDHVFSAGGGVVNIPAGNYKTPTTIVPKSGVSIKGEGVGSTILKTNSSTANAAMWGQGSVGGELTATADYTIGDDSFTMSSAHGFAVDDFVRVIGQRNALSDDASDDWRLGYGTPGSGCAYFGEFLQVKTQDGTTGFTSYSGLSFPDYRNDDTQESDANAKSATTFQKWTPIQDVTISCLTFEIEGNTSAAIRFKHGYNCKVIDVDVRQGDYSGAAVYLADCLNCSADRVAVSYGANIDLIGNKANYNGFKTAGSQGCNFRACDIRNPSQGVDFSYLNLQPVSLHCGVYDSVITSAQVSGLTSHGGTYAITFQGNKIINANQGIACRSRSSVISNNTVTSRHGLGADSSNVYTQYGIGIYEGWARDCVISNNTIQGGFYAGIAINDGADIGETFGYTGLVCTGNTVNSARYGFSRHAAGSNTKTELSSTLIENNIFRNCYTRFVYLDGELAGVTIRGNIMDTLTLGSDGIRLTANTHPHSVIENNHIKDCGSGVDAIEVDPATLTYPYTTNYTCLIRGNTFSGTNGTLINSSSTLLDFNLYSTDALNRQGSLPIIDGVSAPTQLAGVAFIYVDSADGDLKIVFGDGTVKTITTDS